MQATIRNDFLTLTVDTHGAEAVSVQNAQGQEMLWQGDKSVWGRHAPILFPYTGKVLVFPSQRGSGGFLKYGRGNKPAAFLHTVASPLNVLCALQAHVPSMTDFERDPMEVIETGDMVLVNADEGYIEVTKKEG